MISPSVTEIVHSFSALQATPYYDSVNSICWERSLVGNFAELVQKLPLNGDVTAINRKELEALQLTTAGDAARQVILQDLHLLASIGAAPVLNLIKHYHADEEPIVIATDVYSFHVDRSPVPTDTYLCTYYGAASDILLNSEAEQLVLVPAIRQQLLEIYDGPSSGFEDFLTENYFDLHYRAKANAQPINLGNGHLWKLAVDHPSQRVLPCIHRAPKENDGEYRLLLIC